MTEPSPRPERRRAPRALANFPIRFSQDPEAQPGRLRDISEIGLACSSPRALPEMTMVGLDFALPGSVEVHHVTGAVVRCEPARGGTFDLAVYFTEMAPTTRAALAGFVTRGRPAP